MFAVVEIAGQRSKVTIADKIFVPKIEQKVGSKLKFDKVLVLVDETQTKLGTPYVSGSSIEAKVLAHLKDDKVAVFKKKKRKGFKVHRGHRQQYTEIEITRVL